VKILSKQYKAKYVSEKLHVLPVSKKGKDPITAASAHVFPPPIASAPIVTGPEDADSSIFAATEGFVSLAWTRLSPDTEFGSAVSTTPFSSKAGKNKKQAATNKKKGFFNFRV
jgi:hypothetical protein